MPNLEISLDFTAFLFYVIERKKNIEHFSGLKKCLIANILFWHVAREAEEKTEDGDANRIRSQVREPISRAKMPPIK